MSNNDLPHRPNIKRQGSMENLKGSEKGKQKDSDENADFSDYDELLSESK